MEPSTNLLAKYNQYNFIKSPTSASKITVTSEKQEIMPTTSCTKKRKDSAEISDEDIESEPNEKPVFAMSKTDSNAKLTEQKESPKNSSEAIISTPKVVPLYEELYHTYLCGILFKFRPGFSSDYVKCYLKATSNCVKYYKRQCNCWTNIPLLKIYYSDIEYIKRVNTQKKSNLNRIYGKEFEIHMKAGWSLSKSRISNPENISSSNSSPNIGNNIIVRSSSGNSVSPTKKLSFLSKQSSKTSFLNCILPGHLMLKPHLLERYIEESKKIKENPIPQNPEPIKKSVKLGNIEFQEIKEALSYSKFTELHKSQLMKIHDETEELTLSPYALSRNNLGGNAWSYRELDWYLAEEKLLFFTKTEDECKMWVNFLNWIVNNYNKH